jgi:lipid-binding SYLF domain-containing protein
MFKRSVFNALCVGIIFCLATIVTPAQDTQAPAQDSQPPAQDNQQPAPNGQQPSPDNQPPCATPPCVVAQPCVTPCPTPPAGEVKHAVKGSAHAADVFKDFADVRDKIPKDILCKAAAIGVFKGVFNMAFVFGYRQGNGAITVRTPNGWSAPVYYKMKGGNFGWQIGVQSTDFVLVFMSQESIRDLADGEFDLALDANAVIGPVFGARASAGHPDFPKGKTVFVYARSNGAYIGAVVDGAKLYARNNVNRDLYGMNALDLLSDPTRIPTMCAACLPPGVNDFPQAVAASVPPQVIYVQPAAAPAPEPKPEPKPTAAVAPEPEPPTPTPVIIIREEPPAPVEEPKPVPQPKGRRAHKMKD